MESNDRFLYLFRRHMRKTYTQAESEEFMQYLRQPEYDRQLRRLLRQAQEAGLPQYEQPAENADAIFGAIITQQQARAHMTHEPGGEAPVIPLPAARNRIARRLLQYAAAALVVAAAGLGAWHYSHSRVNPARPVAAAPAVKDGRPGHSYIVLPDGSKVLLNSGSHLDYPAAFDGRRREVTLTGEAYFDIHHDARKPFIVHAGHITTVVLGTAFDIRAFPGQENVVVTVSRGKVRVENGSRTLGVLRCNEQITVNSKAGHPVKQTANTAEVMRWKAEDILFDDEPVSAVAAALEKRFGVSIRLENSDLGNCRVTASFLHHETAEDIIRVVSGITHMQYRADSANTILLTGEGCH
jgi:ferric-dicitrate binding protein FerR (iron transport regulator)